MAEKKEKQYVSDNAQLMAEWNWEKNSELGCDPATLTLGIGRKVWWKCDKGHEWDDSILHRSQGRNCPYCSNHRILLGYNNLFATNPELEVEWDYDKNTTIDPMRITAGSHEKVWWMCPKGHSFQSEIRERADGSGCPYCSNKKILPGYNDLVTTDPDLAAEWHYDKNGEFLPSQIGAGSSQKVWWKCVQGHEWLAPVSHRKRGNGCPYCSNKKILKGYNDLATIHPDIAAEWAYDKNGELTPFEVAPASNKKVWWKCKFGHEWQATVLNRHQGNNCPICSNQQILVGYNDLATTHPELIDEWHTEKNGNMHPTNVVAGSSRRVWWIGRCGHEWQTPINSRTNGTGCPYCASGTRISFPEKCTYFYIKKYFPDAQENVRPPELHGLEMDVYIPSLHIGVEYDGGHWHNDLSKDLQKDTLCVENGIVLYRIRETECEAYPKETWFQLADNGIVELTKVIVQLLVLLTKSMVSIDVDIERDRLKIYETMHLFVHERSFEVLFPNLAKHWHPTKNGRLKPSQFSPFAKARVWWLGECGHEWESSIHARTSSGGCPYCSNQRLLPGFNDLATTHPHLLKEWDYERNTLSPAEVFAGSEIPVWWKCELGHSWRTYPYKRKNGEKCPYCSNKRILKGFNDLATVNPKLASEWDFERNELTPDRVPAGSSREVWWRCSVCGHRWKTTIAARNRGNGCKQCANAQLGAKLAETKLVNNGSLFDHYPELAEEWNYKKNVGITPQTTTACNGAKVWWICKTCGHEWEATINNRSKNHGCPACAKIRVQQLKRQTELSRRGSLLQNNPDLAAEWDYERNDVTPAEVFPNSSAKAWWVCSKGHYYEASPNNRIHGRNCPYCSNRKVLTGFNDLATVKPELLLEWNYGKNLDIDPTQVTPGNDRKVWWKCSNCGHEWEARIGNRSRGDRCPVCRRKKK